VIPPDTPEKQAAVNSFFTSKANFETQLPALQVVLKAAKEKWPGVKAWGAVGICWGGKVGVLFKERRCADG
jgi:dienelactone hydrolase